MLDAMPMSCILWDENLKIIDCNEEALHMFQVQSKKEFIQRLYEFSPENQPDGENSKDKIIRLSKEAFDNGCCKFEWEHQLSDGTRLPCGVTLVRVKYDDIYAVAAFTRDIRVHLKMMDDIRQRDALLMAVNYAVGCLLDSVIDDFTSSLFNALGVVANAVDADRVYIGKNYWDDTSMRSTIIHEWSGGSRPISTKKQTVDLSLDSIMPDWKKRLEQGNCTNKTVTEAAPELKAHMLKYGIKSILLIPVYVRNVFWGFIGFDDCRNERRFTENEESILHSSSLLIVNAVLRNETTEEREAALEKARMASLAKSNFLSNMSHEIRTPINAIIGMTVIGKNSDEIERKNYAFEKIEGASQHLLGVINDVLDMSKIEANKFELSFEEFEFDKVIRKAVDVVSFRVEERQQKLSVTTDPRIPLNLMGDDQRLTQVITNLLSNAVKFTPEHGEIKLNVHYKGMENNLCGIRVEIIDTGIGISEEQQQRLFNSFEQAESSISRRFGGTGLGLSISNHIIKQMGGEIWIESKLGEGAAFIFSLQLMRGDGTEKQTSPTLSGKKVKILIVDDDPGTLEYFKFITRKFDIVCHFALDGIEALEMVKIGNKYDICFIDWEMPHMNGMELCKRLREQQNFDANVILISGHDINRYEQEAKINGVDGFLEKPLFPDDVIEYINKYSNKPTKLPAEQEEEVQTPSLKGKRMLLAEDVDINQEIVISLFEPTMIEIDIAENGVEALRMFKNDPKRYDLILMDVQMPEMDGLEAARQIRALGTPEAENIPILAMTANVFKEDIEKCIKSGMNDHIGKPIDYDDMMGKVMRFF